MTDAATKTTVTIVGGGIAGLTVAYELARSGRFEIDVYDQNDSMLGGKARSMRFPDGNVGEHALRVYLAAYRALFQTMTEIPFERRSTYDNLVYTPLVFRRHDDSFTLPATYSNVLSQAKTALELFRFIQRQGVPVGELILFTWRVGALLWMCDERVRDKVDIKSFEQYLDGPNRSLAFREVVFVLSELIVAAKRTASAQIVARILLEWFVTPFLKSPYHRKGFASLNGPTSERFLDPWIALLRSMGVRFHLAHKVSAVEMGGGQVACVKFTDGSIAASDLFVLAVQQNALAALLTGALENALPSLQVLKKLGQEWSNGAQFFLKSVPAAWQCYVGVVTMRLDAPWSIVFSIQKNGAQWDGVPLPPGTAAVLSLAYSNVFHNGVVHGKPFNQCTHSEILDECLAQLGLTGDAGAVAEGVVDPDLLYVDEAVYAAEPQKYAGYIVSRIPGSSQLIATQSTLYIRDPGNLSAEPRNETEVENLFLAGEFTSTRFELPTMEKANESGKRCACAICERAGIPYDTERFRSSELPLSWLRRLDGLFYRAQRWVGRGLGRPRP